MLPPHFGHSPRDCFPVKSIFGAAVLALRSPFGFGSRFSNSKPTSFLSVTTRNALNGLPLRELTRSIKPFAFLAAEAAQRPDLFVAHESLELVTAQQPAGDRFPNREVAFLICAGEALESFDHGRTALRALAERLGVGHVLVGMKMFGF